MPVSNLLYARDIKINDKISVKIPTVGEILDDETNYYTILSIFTAMPIDFIAQLDEMGIDFSKITPFEMFLEFFPYVATMDTSLFFGDMKLGDFQYAVNDENGKVVLINPTNGIMIDKAVHSMIASALRKIHGRKKDTRRPANDDARDYMIQVAKRKAKRRRKRIEQSQLESLIIAMVNTHQYKYDFESTKSMTIYQFTESVKQVIKKIDYENKMYGVYSGSIKAKDLSQDDLDWTKH